MFIFFLFLPPLYPSGFAFSANPALCSSPRQHPHRHLPLGARLLSSGRLETAVPERGRGFTQRAASRGGNNPGGGEKRVCLTTWSTCTHECRLKKHNNEHKVFLKKKKKRERECKLCLSVSLSLLTHTLLIVLAIVYVFNNQNEIYKRPRYY